MIVIVEYEIHAYEGEELRDDYLIRGNCLYGEDVIQKLNNRNNKSFLFEYSEETVLSDLLQAIRIDLGLGSEEYEMLSIHTSFINNGLRYYPDIQESNLSFILQKYLLYPDGKTIHACILLSCSAGCVDSDDKLRYCVHSRERGKHNKPHVHVNDVGHNYYATVSIETGEVLEGKLPTKLERMAKERILSKQRFFYDCWNTMTDGLMVDINKALGLIGY